MTATQKALASNRAQISEIRAMMRGNATAARIHRARAAALSPATSTATDTDTDDLGWNESIVTATSENHTIVSRCS